MKSLSIRPSSLARAAALSILACLAQAADAPPSTIQSLAAPAAPPAAAKPAPDAPDPKLEAAAREIIGFLDKKLFGQVISKLTPEAAAAMPADSLEKVWSQITTAYGGLKSQGAARQSSVQQQGARIRMLQVPCVFERGPLDATINFDDQNRVVGLFFAVPGAAAAKPPASISEISATIGIGEDSLPGTIALPRGAGPWPGVVLVQDTGPLDRDGSLGAEKPMRDFAWGLAERGVAVLRYDKRTLAHRDQKEQLRDKLTVDIEITNDAVAALGALSKLTVVDPARLFLVGHGMGGMLVPRIADRAKSAAVPVAGLAFLAPEARMPHVLMGEQLQYIVALDGKIDDQEQKEIDRFKPEAAEVDRILKDGKGSGASIILGAPPIYWLSLRGYDAPASAVALELPVLFLHGHRDYQVPDADAKLWQAAIGGLPRATAKEYPSLNHLFIAGEGPSAPAEYQKSARVDTQAITDLADWIKGQAASSAPAAQPAAAK